MEADEARARLERAVAFTNARDLDAVLDMVHPEARWIPPAGGSQDVVYEGREGVRTFITEWLEPWDAFHQDVIDVQVKGARSLARIRVRARGKASGVELDLEAGYVTEIDDDGLLRRMELYASYSDAKAAF